jgi:hypothetical protein
MSTALIILLSIAIFSLAAAILWRGGGKRHSQSLELAMQKELHELKAQQNDFAEASVASNTEAYDRGRERLTAVRDQIDSLKGRFHGEAENRSKQAMADVETLGARLEENVRAIRSVSASMARRAQESVSRRIERLKARVFLVLAATKAEEARTAALEQHLPEAEELLDEAMDLMRRASQDLASEPEYQRLIDNLSRASREVGICLRSHAQWTVSKMDRMLAENDRLVRYGASRTMKPTLRKDLPKLANCVATSF